MENATIQDPSTLEERIPCAACTAAHGQMHGQVQIPEFGVTSWMMLCAGMEEFTMVVCSFQPLHDDQRKKIKIKIKNLPMIVTHNPRSVTHENCLILYP